MKVRDELFIIDSKVNVLPFQGLSASSSYCHCAMCWCVCVFVRVCPCAFNSLSRQPDGFLCLWASVVGPLSFSCDAIILSGAAVFSWGKEVISFPAFVWAWMRAALFQQYSLVSTPFSIRTKIYTPCHGPITHVGPRKIATSSIGLISLTRFWTAVSPGLSGSLSCVFHQVYRTLPVESPERKRERGARMGASQSA